MGEPIEFKSEAARLITRTSSARTGIGDYVVKRDFRRELDQEWRREGYDYFWPFEDGDTPGVQPFPHGGLAVGDPITLVHLARRPNGQHTIVVGTQTTLWRFQGSGAGPYYLGTGPDAYYEEPPKPSSPYYLDILAGTWSKIGDGFSTKGHRWESLNINGWAVFNNGYDLPVTFRIEESEVVPIYELREQGVACVGTIGETNGVLLCGDITEIPGEALVLLMRPLGDIFSGNVTVTKPVGIATASTPTDFFNLEHAGRWIALYDGTSYKIQEYLTPRTVRLGTSDLGARFSGQRFVLKNKAAQAGALASGLITATTSGPVVTSDGAFFTSGMVTKKIRFSNGVTANITGFTDTTHITINPAPADPIVGLPFWITDVTDAKILIADAVAFTSDMVGRQIIFENGQTRIIEAFVDSKTVKVDLDWAVESSFFHLDNQASYGPYDNPSVTDRVHYRVLWSMPDFPRRFGALIPAAIEAGSQELHLLFPSKSFEVGQEVLVAGAGESGGNLTTKILNVIEQGQQFLLADEAVTTVDAGTDPSTDDGFVEQADAVASIVGYDDLQGDSSAILRILALGQSTCLIYKDTCMFVATYTGLVAEPFRFDRIEVPEAMTLYYRYTLINAGGLFHVFAGNNNWYRMNLGARMPVVISELNMVSDKFFDQVVLQDSDQIFCADNSLTNEIFIWYPSLGEQCLCYDYKQNSVSTSSMIMTAAATVKKPSLVTEFAGVTEDLFVMGNPEGTVLVYGKADQPQKSFGDKREIHYRRAWVPYDSTRGEYESEIKSGYGDFGQPHHTKDLTAHVLYCASQSPDCELQLNWWGDRNPNDDEVLLGASVVESPKKENLVPMFFRQHYYAYSLLITGKDNPCKIAGHTFEIGLVTSSSHERREGTPGT